MIFYIFFILMAMGSIQSCQDADARPKIANISADWQLVWSDEFDKDGLPNRSNWTYDVGDGCPDVCGWGNNELQFYTHENRHNARIKDGNLHIQAHRENIKGNAYSSARLVTRGLHAWKYGKVEARIQLPSGRGIWPAVWMLSEDNKYGGWPQSGEIDIMEHVGFTPDSIYGTVHTAAYNHMLGTQKGKSAALVDAGQTYHEFSIEWDAKRITWYLDDVEYYTFENTQKSEKEWPFDQKFHLILNLAVGGNWGGLKGIDENIWPQQMLVDYVRVYQKK